MGYRIVTEEWAPYNYVEDGKLKGISFDIVEALMALTHDRFPIEVLPSMRTTEVLSTNPLTIMFSLFRTKEREPLYKWVGPIVEETIYPYALKKDPVSATTIEELKSVSSIVTRFAGLVPTRMQTLGFLNLDPSAPTSEQLYRMLFAGRAQVIVGDTDLGVRYYLRRANLDYGALQKVPIEIVHSELYIAFSRGSEDRVVRAWAAALEELKRTGVLARILASYQ